MFFIQNSTNNHLLVKIFKSCASGRKCQKVKKKKIKFTEVQAYLLPKIIL